jgi:hypothetical protein
MILLYFNGSDSIKLTITRNGTEITKQDVMMERALLKQKGCFS